MTGPTVPFHLSENNLETPPEGSSPHPLRRDTPGSIGESRRPVGAPKKKALLVDFEGDT